MWDCLFGIKVPRQINTVMLRHRRWKRLLLLADVSEANDYIESRHSETFISLQEKMNCFIEDLISYGVTQVTYRLSKDSGDGR